MMHPIPGSRIIAGWPRKRSARTEYIRMPHLPVLAGGWHMSRKRLQSKYACHLQYMQYMQSPPTRANGSASRAVTTAVTWPSLVTVAQHRYHHHHQYYYTLVVYSAVLRNLQSNPSGFAYLTYQTPVHRCDGALRCFASILSHFLYGGADRRQRSGPTWIVRLL